MSIRPETRENLNLWMTMIAAATAVIVGITLPFAFGYLGSKLEATATAITAHSDQNVATLKQAITEKEETFESKTDHQRDMDAQNAALAATKQILFQGQKDLSDKFDKENIEQRLESLHMEDKLDALAPKTTINQTPEKR